MKHLTSLPSQAATSGSDIRQSGLAVRHEAPRQPGKPSLAWGGKTKEKRECEWEREPLHQWEERGRERREDG